MFQKIKQLYKQSDTLNRRQLWWFYGIAGGFILLNAFLIRNEIFLAPLLPLLLVIVLTAFTALDKLMLAIVFFTPLSIGLQEFWPDMSFNMFIPTEPLLFGVMLMFFMKLLLENNFDKKIAWHPVSIALYINLLWLFITSITSTMPIVSFKFFLSRLWFVVAFYFIATQVFTKQGNIKRFYWLYLIPLLFVMSYSIIRLAGHGLFNQQVAHWVMTPFYNDHTSYGAILAMFFPILIGLGTRSNYSLYGKIFIWLLVGFFVFAIVLSYTRAAWLSLVGALGVWMLILLRVKLRMLILMAIIALGIFWHYQDKVFMMMQENKQDSSTDLKEHVKSMSNVASDASNLERINRWKSALRMFEEKPVFGWGPGTYMFQYAPYQMSYEKTIISTNAGDMGNAHSEYIGPLSESGVLGMLTFVAVIVATIFTALRAYYRLKNTELRMLVLVSFLGLVTYYLHGFLNNFLDTDKASAPFWGFTAVIVAIDVYHSKQEQARMAKETNATSEPVS